MMNALRLTEGFPPRFYIERTGRFRSSAEPTVNSLVKRGPLTETTDQIAPTPLSQRFLNEVLGAFLFAE